MNTEPANLHRNLPTLTEVVDPTSLVNVPTGNPNQEDIIQSVLAQLGPEMARRLNHVSDDAIQKLLAQQRQILLEQFRLELETSVRQMVSAHFKTSLDQGNAK